MRDVIEGKTRATTSLKSNARGEFKKEIIREKKNSSQREREKEGMGARVKTICSCSRTEGGGAREKEN